MTLQILITRYQEPDEVIKPLLDSIALQIGVNFADVGVIVCNDGTHFSIDTSQYPYHIEVHDEPHRGISGTRNACLDYADAEYVMWCDADDMFCTAFGLLTILGEIKHSHPNMLVSKFIEEVYRPDGALVLARHEMDGTFVHGKAFKRQFLLDNDLRFCDRLLCHEDSYFIALSAIVAGNVEYTEQCFYLYKYNANSIVRRDPQTFILRTFTDMVKSNDALVSELERRGFAENATSYAYNLVSFAYLNLTKAKWHLVDEHYKKDAEQYTINYLRKHMNLWTACTESRKEEARDEAYKDVPMLQPPAIPVIDSWAQDMVKRGED